MSPEPIIVIANSKIEAEIWADTHIKPSERQPVCTTNPKDLIGCRGRVIVILPKVKLQMEEVFVLSKNIIIDLEGF